MYGIALKLRQAFRWLAAVFAVALLVAVALVAVLPFLIEGHGVRESLIRSLSAWSGGAVTLDGPLRIANFASLSIEAKGVRFAATPRLAPIGAVQARSVIATARLRSLLLGHLEFKTVLLESPRFVFKRDTAQARLSFSGVESAGPALALAERSPFEHLKLRDCLFVSAQTGHGAYKRFRVGEISVDKEAAGAGSNTYPASLYLRDIGFEASFRGILDSLGQSALGAFRLTAASSHPAAERITASIAPWENGQSVSLGGDLSWSGARAALDNARVSFGDHGAKGSLALAVRRGRGLLEGTLAYDKLDWVRAPRKDGEAGGTLLDSVRALTFASGEAGRNLDLDMRISAERFLAGPYEAGPLALALTSSGGRFSLDIAELALFGGKITGRIDYDYAHPLPLTIKASGTHIDSGVLASALMLPFGVSGQAAVRLALDMPLSGKPLAEEMQASTSNFTIEFPSGGTIEGDFSRQLSAAFERRDLFWSLASNSVPFNAASIEGSATPGGVNMRIDGEYAGGRIDGSIRVASPGNAVSGTLSVIESQEKEPEDGAPGAAPASPAPANIKLSGTLADLSFSPPGKPSLSN
jgi:uncharacterized protein involved in outer membrane biogenesis